MILNRNFIILMRIFRNLIFLIRDIIKRKIYFRVGILLRVNETSPLNHTLKKIREIG